MSLVKSYLFFRLSLMTLQRYILFFERTIILDDLLIFRAERLKFVDYFVPLQADRCKLLPSLWLFVAFQAVNIQAIHHLQVEQVAQQVEKVII
jgi:hypothetical protein